MDVKFSRNSWHHRLYDYTFNSDEPPQYLCAYFWLMVLAVLMIPLSAIGSIWYIFDTRDYADPPRFILGTLLAGMVFVMAWLLMGFCFLASIIVSSAPLMAGTGLLIALALGSFFSRDLWIPFAASTYKRVCPFIEWQDEEQE